MYSLLRSASVKTLLAEQALPLAGSVVIAEVFYKFHSFTLECIAFLATWAILDAGLAAVTGRLRPRQP
jgi:hypothetical protein